MRVVSIRLGNDKIAVFTKTMYIDVYTYYPLIITDSNVLKLCPICNREMNIVYNTYIQISGYSNIGEIFTLFNYFKNMKNVVCTKEHTFTLTTGL